MPFSVWTLLQVAGESGHDPAKYMTAPTIIPTKAPTTNNARIESLSLLKAAGQAPNMQTTKITAPSFIWSVDLVLRGAAEGAGFTCKGFAVYAADAPQFRQKLSARSIGFPHLPQNKRASKRFSLRLAAQPRAVQFALLRRNAIPQRCLKSVSPITGISRCRL
jgi:hypothetical protein